MSERSDLDILSDLGLEPIERKKVATSPREARIIAGFEDVQRFAEEQGSAPQHGADRDIFERIYAVRLDRLRSQEECRNLLKDIDTQALLSGAVEDAENATRPADLDDEELLVALGVSDKVSSGLTDLRYVRTHAERRSAEDIASRQPSEDFDKFKPLFDAVKADIASGARQTLRFERKSEIEPGRFFIVDGLTAYVAHAGDPFTNESGNRDSRLRVIFDNGTESNLLARSLQKALTQDPAGRRITDPDAGPLFYYPGSHRWPIISNLMIGRRGQGTSLSSAQEPYGAAWAALREAYGATEERFLARKGQALIWCANLLHGGSPQADPRRTRWSPAASCTSTARTARPMFPSRRPTRPSTRI